MYSKKHSCYKQNCSLFHHFFCYHFSLCSVNSVTSFPFVLISSPLSSSPSSTLSHSAPLTPLSLCLCMLLTCSCCSACSELFVQVSAVKATLVGPLSWSLWLSGSPLREPKGGCHYTHYQWDRHNGLALSIVWAQAWGWHQHLMHSTPVSLPPSPCPAPKHLLQCNTRVSLRSALENCNGSTLPEPVQCNQTRSLNFTAPPL